MSCLLVMLLICLAHVGTGCADCSWEAVAHRPPGFYTSEVQQALANKMGKRFQPISNITHCIRFPEDVLLHETICICMGISVVESSDGEHHYNPSYGHFKNAKLTNFIFSTQHRDFRPFFAALKRNRRCVGSGKSVG